MAKGPSKADRERAEAAVKAAAGGTGWEVITEPAELLSLQADRAAVEELGGLVKNICEFSDEHKERTKGWLGRAFPTEDAAKLFVRRLRKAFEVTGRSVAVEGPVKRADGTFYLQVKARRQREQTAAGAAEGAAEAGMSPVAPAAS